jgi:Ca-activated chloride channel homolog
VSDVTPDGTRIFHTASKSRGNSCLNQKFLIQQLQFFSSIHLMLRFQYIEFLYLLAALPLLSVFYYMLRRYRLALLKRYGDLKLIASLYPDVSPVKSLVKFVVLMTALGFLVFAMANLQIGTKLEEGTRKGGDIIVAVDVSNSMLAKDNSSETALSRLDLAKLSVSKLIDKLRGDQIGIITFAGEASLHLPLTSDYSAAKLFLGTVSTDIIPTQGTAISKAIEIAESSFKIDTSEENGQKVVYNDMAGKTLIIITDGEDHEKNVLEEAKKAADKGIIIHTIGMGSPNGSPIPEKTESGSTSGFMRDEGGNIILSRLNEDVLQKIASIGGGTYLSASNGDPNFANLMEELGKSEKKEFGTMKFSEYESGFQYFAAAAFLLLLAEIFISEKKSRIFASLNLFEENKSNRK